MIQTMSVEDKAGRVTTYCQKLANIYLHRGDVIVRDSNGYLAYCVVKKGEINMNYRMISEQYCANDDDKALMLSLALNYHEIQHLEMTKKPRNLRYDALSVHNLLEDGRIETLGVKKFNKLADYFHHAVCTILLKDGVVSHDPIANISNYLLLYGRKIFMKGNPAIATSRAVCVKLFTEKNVEKLEKYVDDYLVSTTQTERGQISNDVADLIRSLSKQNPQIPNGFGHEDIENTQNDSDDADDKDDGAGVDRASLKKENDKAKADQKGNVSKSTHDVLNDMVEAMDKVKEVRKDITKKKKEYGDFIGKARLELDQKKKQANEVTAQKMWSDICKAEQKVQDLNTSVENKANDMNNEIAGILQSIGDAVKGRASEELKAIKQIITDDAYADLTTFCVDTDAEAQVNKIAKNMHKLNIELGRGNVSHQVAGRLNVRSFMNRKDKADLKIFDKYIPSRLNRSKMLVNIFLDSSGSMSQHDGDSNKTERWENAKKSTWILANSLERHENQVMCVAWADFGSIQTFKEYGKILKAPRHFKGNTYPEGALESSLETIQEYKKKNGFKAVMTILVTDGDFNDNMAVYNSVKKYIEAGHHFILIRVGQYFNANCTPIPANETIRLNNFNELSDMVIKTFTKMKKSLNKQVR